ncbi:hypothetical protein LQW54_013558 [Pestalotiopsis sp. IQ-011]
MPPTQTSGLRTVDKLIAGYGSLSVPTLLEPLADDFQHHVLPESLEMPAKNKQSFAQHAAGVFGIFEKFRMVPVSTYEDRDANAVVVHAHMQGTMKKGAMEWRNECIMLIRLSEDGSQVKEIIEFVDSAKAKQMQQKHAPEVFSSSSGSSATGRFAANLIPSFQQIAAVCILYQLGLSATLWLLRRR